MSDIKLKKVETLLSPQPGEQSGYITPDDLKQSFEQVFVAIDEVQGMLPDTTAAVVAQMSANSSAKGVADKRPLFEILNDLRYVLSGWLNNIDVNEKAAGTKSGQEALFPPVGGEANPSTVAQLAVVVNNLIFALDSVGIIRDVRGGSAPPSPAQVPPTGLVAPTAPSTVYTLAPANATVPDDLVALKADAAVGDAALAAAGQGAFATAEYLTLADGSRASWDGSAWSVWTPPISGIAPPTGTGAVEWRFIPFGAPIPANLAALKADATVGDAALTAASLPPFVTDQFILLGDGSQAFWTAVGPAAVAQFEWQAGVAP